MVLKRAIILSVFVAALIATASPAPVFAQQSQRLRGEIEKVDGNTITVRSQDGKNVKVVLDGDYTVAHAVPIKLSDIKPGTYVGVGAFPDGAGLKAAHVQVFPPGTAAREGHGAWSADPSGTMTNAPVTAVVAGQKDGKITLTTKGQNYDITVPPDAPVVKTEPGTKALVKPGARIGISSAVDRNGVLSTKAIIISDDPRFPVR